MTRIIEEIVFDPMPNRETASLGTMLELPMVEGGVTDDADEKLRA